MIRIEYYDFRDWIAWPESDIVQYANEIAVAQGLSESEADYLRSAMTRRAGYRPVRREQYGPRIMNPTEEGLFRQLGNGDDAVFAENARRNKPYVDQKFTRQSRTELVGRGLTLRKKLLIEKESKALRKYRQRDRKRTAERPFSSMYQSLIVITDHALWAANCYPVSNKDWIIRPEEEKPFEGLVWYSRELMAAYSNAKDQARLGNIEAALWHAFRAGSLNSELEIRLAHAEKFEIYEAVNQAQRDAAHARRKVPNESRIEAYWRYRKAGHKRIEAGRLAADELGISEPSIRNAFPKGRYPQE
ncbi:hypothetical protein [Novosphingobium arvoryzae]|uniref:hypothetical protein n=1 Tax=Novosphingobium arvoryzae TaxID=1256514 RepID=UPI0035AEAFE0